MTILVPIPKRDTLSGGEADHGPEIVEVEIGIEIETERRGLGQDLLVEDIVQDPEIENKRKRKKKPKEIGNGRRGVYQL